MRIKADTLLRAGADLEKILTALQMGVALK